MNPKISAHRAATYFPDARLMIGLTVTTRGDDETTKMQHYSSTAREAADMVPGQGQPVKARHQNAFR